jgi:hypothetical protein
MSTTSATATTHAPIIIANDNRGGSAFMIETGDIAAGIVVREEKTYRFFAAHNDFRTIDGNVFESPKAAQKAADIMHASTRHELKRARRD